MPNDEDFGSLKGEGTFFIEGLKGGIDFFSRNPVGAEALNGVCLFEDALPKGVLATLSGNFVDLGGGNPKLDADFSFGTEVPNGETGCFPGEEVSEDIPNGEALCFADTPTVFFGGDPKVLGGAKFGALAFFEGSEPKPGRSLEDDTEVCLGEPTEKFFFVGGDTPKFDVLEEDDC